MKNYSFFQTLLKTIVFANVYHLKNNEGKSGCESNKDFPLEQHLEFVMDTLAWGLWGASPI